MEAVDGADVGEDALNNITGEGGPGASLLQQPGTENLGGGVGRSADANKRRRVGSSGELLPGPAGGA